MLTSGGFKPDLQVIDNKESTTMKENMIKLGMMIQLVPPGNHKAKVCIINSGIQGKCFHSTLHN